MLEEFREWQFEVKNSTDEWVDNLVKEALTKGTYKKAETWLKDNMPELTGDYHGSISEQLNSIARTIFQNAIYEIRNTAMKQETK